MTKDQLIEFIQDIVFQANIIKEQLVKDNAPVNYACIFCQSDDEYNQFIALGDILWARIQDTPTGPLYHVIDISTVAGSLPLVKIRYPDETRLERGDADFTLSDYQSFKSKSLGEPGYKLIQRENFEMIEYQKEGSNVLVYFSFPPLDQQLGLTL